MPKTAAGPRSKRSGSGGLHTDSAPNDSAPDERKGRKRLQRPFSFCALSWPAGACPVALRRIVHLELDRVRGVLEGEDLLPLEFQVGVDLILGEDVAGEQEVVVRRQRLDRLA